MKLLLTAFDPFGGESVNASLEAARLVAAPDLALQVIPTVFRDSGAVLAEALRRERPDAVLCLGQASRRAGLTPERIAVNCDDARSPDNAGDRPVDRPIVPGGPAAYFSTLPIRAMTEAIRQAGVPADISNSAGTFVCNHLMYCLLHLLATEYPGVRGGFLHVPSTPAQAPDGSRPSLSSAAAAAGLAAAIRVIRET